MEQKQVHAAKHLAVTAIILILLGPITLIGFVVPVEGAAAKVYFAAISPDASGYAVDETVKLNVKYGWEGISANTTVAIQLWNSTDLMEALGDFTVYIGGPDDMTSKGTKTVQYTPTVDLTEKVSTTTYSLKMLSGGITVDTASFTIIVAASQITMSITWQDQNNDRIVDVNELVTFTAYVNWAFVENTEAHSLYVNYGDGEKLLCTVSVTAGSGSQTATDSHGYSSKGAKTATFTLKDATGTTVVTRAASLTVGAVTPTPAPVAQAPVSFVGILAANWAIIAIIGSAVVIGYVYMGGGKKIKARRGK